MAGLGLSAQPFAAWFTSPVWYMVAIAIMVIVFWKQWRILILAAAIAGALVGLCRGSGDSLARNIYQPLLGKDIELSGVVMEDPDLDKQGATTLRLTSISFASKKLPGPLWVTVKKEGIKRSDTVTVKGKLSPGFGNFVASMYRAEVVKIERAEIGDIALRARDSFAEQVRKGIDEPAASLGLGYLLGQRRALPPDLDEALKIAGLTHIVVASGYNLTILVRAMRRLFQKYSRYLTVFLAGLLVVCFMFVTGFSPSMTRAGLVAGLALAAWYYGRKFHPMTLIAFAAMVTGMIEPSSVWGNLGWQLSFAAFFGVMVIAPLLQAYFFGDDKPKMFRQILGETIAAQIATAPLILLAFGQISVVAVVANALVLPLVPLAMMLTFITGLVGYSLPGFVELAGLPAQWLLDYMVAVAKTTASVPWAQASMEIQLVGFTLLYTCIIAGCLYMQRATGYKLRAGSIVE